MKPPLRRRPPARMRIEEVEARILHSADALALLDPGLATGMANVRMLDAPPAPAPALSAPPAATQTAEQPAQRHEIVFIDPRVPDARMLAADIYLRGDANRHLEIVDLDPDEDGITQIGRVLAARHDIATVHLISHGADGRVELGNRVLTFETLRDEAARIKAWGNALTEDADLLIYGCDVAASANGKALINALARLTGADVAASDNPTGSALKGGDWNLEYASGSIEASVAISQSGQNAWSNLLAITANSTSSGMTSSAGANSLTWSHTIASGSNRALFVGLAIENGATSTGVTYGGTVMTLVGRSTGTETVEIWRLLAPTVGTANIVATFSGTQQGVGGAAAYDGVNQTTPTGTFAAAGGTSTAPSVAVTSAAGDLVIDTLYGNDGPTVTIGGGQTAHWNLATGSGASKVRGAGSTEAGAASVTMSWTLSSAVQWRIGGVSIKAAISDIAPVNTVPSAQSVNEDTAKVFSSGNGNQISITDADAGGANNEVTLGVTNGTLTLAGTTGLSFSAGTGTANTSMTFRGTASAINSALNGLTYDPSANYNGSATLTLATKDSTLLSLDIDTSLKGRYAFENTGALGTDTSPAVGFPGTVSGATAAVDGTRGNVLSLNGTSYIQTTGHFGNPTDVTLAAWVNLTTADTLGSHVISLGDSVLFTVDEPSGSNGVTGVYYNGSAWTKLTSGQFIAGTGWHHLAYTFDDTSNTNSLYIDGSLVASAAAATSISYTQGANSYIGKHGNGNTSFDFTGKIDDARIYNRALTALEISALATDLSQTDTDTVAITVAAVNDAPTATITPLTYAATEQTSLTLHGTGLSIADVDAGSATVQATLGVVSGTLTVGAGTTGVTVSNSGTATVTLSGTIAQINNLLAGSLSGTVTYIQNSDAPPASDTLTLTASDLGNTGTGGTLTANDTATINITAVNDAPTLTNAATVTLGATTENTASSGTAVSSILAGASWADGDASPLSGIAITSKSGNGAWQYSTDGTTWNGFGVVSATNALLLTATTQVRYIPDSANAETATFGLMAWDQTTGTASTNSTAAYANPGTGGGSSAYSSQSASASLAVTAVNDAPTVTDRALSFDGTDIVVVAPQANLVMTSTLTIEATVQRTGAISATQIILNKEGEYEIGVSATGKLQWAFANTAPGWAWVQTAFTVPVDTWVQVAVTYNSGVVKAYANGALVDTYNGSGNIGDIYPALNNLSIGGRQNTTASRFVGLIDEVRVWNVERSGAAILAAYNTTLTGAEGGLVGYWRFSETSGTTATDSSTQGFNGVLGNGVAADVPARTGNLDYATSEDTTLNVAATGVLNRATDTEGTALTATLVSGPSNAAAFTLNANGSFSYTPGANFSGTDSFVFTASDGSLASQQATVTLTVAAVNDAPTATITPLTYSATEQTSLTLHGTGLAIADVDAGSATVQATLGVVSGTLTVAAGTTGVTVSNSGTATVTLSGTISQINNLLAGSLSGTVTYILNSDTPAASDTLTLTASDLGNTGTGGTLTGNDTATINITAVNDAPTATITPLTYAATEQTSLTLHGTGLSIADVDAGNATVQATLGVVSGTLTVAAGTTGVTVSNSGTAIVTLSGTITQINNLLAGSLSGTVTYILNSDTPSATDTLTLTASDLGNTGTGGTLTGNDTATINITAVNDAPTFSSGDGMAYTAIGAGTSDFINATVVQPDGKILAAGYSTNAGNNDFALVRYNADGSLDLSFGGGDGIVTTAVGSSSDIANSITVLGSGKILLTGTSVVSSVNQIALVQYNADGTLDTGFGGGDGIATGGIAGAEGNTMAVQSDGKIVVGGRFANNFLVARFNSDGTLDTGFGSSGSATADLAGATDIGYSLAIQSDGMIVMAGQAFSGTSFDIGVIRLTSSGALDTAFDGDGKVLTDIGANSSDAGYRLALQSDGKIVITGWSDAAGTTDVVVVRYNSNGSLDTTFSSDGKLTTAFGSGSDFGQAITIQNDGKIVVAGHSSSAGGNFALIRYLADGSLDTTFNTTGIVDQTFLGSSDDRATSVVVQNDGRILVAGTTTAGGNYDFAIARYTATGALDARLDLVNTLGGTISYTENGAAVVLDSDVVIFDAELSAANNFSGATLTLARNGTANAEDVFSAAGGLTLATGNVVVSSTTIGTYTNSAGTLALTFNGSATQALVNSAMRGIAYGNSNDTPPASVQIDWTFSDSNGGSQGSGGALATTGSTTVNITAVNDAPTATITPLTYAATEQTSLTLHGTGLSIADVDAGSATVQATLGVVSGTLNVAAGTTGVTVSNSGTATVALSGTISQINNLLAGSPSGTVTYINNSDTPAATDTLTLTASDLGNTGTGGTLTGNDTATINITAVNDAPTATITPLTYAATEQTSLTLHGTGLSIADVDAGSATVQATLGVVSGTLTVGAGTTGVTVTNSGTATVTLSGTISQINNLLAGSLGGAVTYILNSDAPAASDTLTLTASDLGNTGTGGTLTANDTATINITAVNDAPTATITPLTYAATEQTSLILHGTGLSIADVDAGSATVQATLGVVSGTLTVAAGTTGVTVSNSGTATVTLSGTLAQINNLLAGSLSSTVTYILNSDAPAATDTLTLTASDLGNTGTGGTLTANDTATINITAVNDAPTATITPLTYAATEQTSLTLHGTGLSIADVDAGSATMQATLGVVSGTLTVGAGTTGVTVTNSGTATVTLSGTISQINNLLAGSLSGAVTYIINSDTPPASDTLTLTASDLGNTGTGGTLTANDTATINITAVNDAPTATITPLTYSATEQTSLILHGTGLSITDVDAGSATVQATLGVVSGTLTVGAGTTGVTVSNSGTATVTLSGTITQINNLLAGSLSGTVTYILNSDAPPASDTLTLTASDLGNTGAGGTLTANDTATINITAVNDAPTATITPLTYAATEQTALTLHGTGLSIADVDAGSASVQTTLSVASGTLTAAAGTSGVSVAGSGTASVTLTGTLTQINNFLAGNLGATSVYFNSSDNPVADTLTLLVDDQGNTGGGALTGSDTATINIAAVNDTPTGTDKSISINEDATYTFSAADFGFSDVDTGDSVSGVRIDTLPVAGALTLSGVAVTAAQVVTTANIGNLVFTPALDDNGAGYASFTFSVRDQGAAFDTVPNTITFNVTAVNDAPVRTAGSVANLTVLEDSGFTSLGFGSVAYAAGGGSDETGQTLSYSVTTLPSGTLGNVYLADGTTLVTTTSYTLADIRGMQFKPTANASGGSAFQYNVTDSGGTSNGGLNSISEFILLTVTGVNDAPTLTATAANPGFTETAGLGTQAAAVNVFSGAAASTIETGQTLTGLTFTVSGLADGASEVLVVNGTTIALGANSSGTTTTNSLTYNVAISGAAATAVLSNGTLSAAAMQTLVNGITYQNTSSDNPTAGNRVFTLTQVKDSGGTSNGGVNATTLAIASTVTVNPVNDAPTATITPVTYGATEQTSLTLDGTGLAIADVDAGSSTVQATLGVVSGALTVASGTTGVTVSNSGTATVTLSGTITQINNLLAGSLGGTVAYIQNSDTPPANDPLTLTVSDLGNTGTGGSLTANDTATINITAVNDAPTTSAVTLAAIAEDSGVRLITQAQLLANAADVDGPGLTAANLAISSGGGSLVDNGNGTWSYTPAPNDDTAVSFSYTVTDGTASVAGTASLDITPVNDAPVLTAAAPLLATITEDQTGNAGQTVAALVGATITDVDAGAIQGVAINGLTSGNGSWEYSTNAGSSWAAIGAVSDSAALLLRSSDLLRFVPNGQNATAGDISFRAWDRTSGTFGTKVDASTNGGTTAFSTSTDTASISVTAVNDAPVLTAAAPVLATLTENQTANAGQTVAAIVAASISDLDTGATQGIAINGLTSGNGTWEYSTNAGSSWSAVGTVSDAAALLLRSTDLVRFVPNGQNATTGDISLRAWDRTSGAFGTKVDTSANGGTTAFSTASDIASISVTAVNDAPVLTAAAPVFAALTEDQTSNAGQTIASIVASTITDVDASAIPGIAINGLTSGNGSWEYSTNAGSSWSAVGAVSDSTALLLRSTDLVRFVPDGQNATSAALSYRAWDQTSGALGSKVDTSSNGGTTAFSTSTDTASINVTAVNDAPVLTAAAPVMAALTEDQTANPGQTVASIVAASITDVDAGAIYGIAINGVTSGNGSWEYSTNAGSSWSAVGVVSDSAALLLRSADLVRFVPDGQNATSATLSFRAWDQTSGAAGSKVDTSSNGGTTAFSTSTDTASINVTAVNDAPVLTAAAPVLAILTEDQTGNPGQTVASIVATSITDVDAGAIQGVAINGLTSGNGSWEYSTNAGSSWSTVGAVSDSTALLLRSTDLVRFVPDGQNATSATLSFRAWDQTSGAAGSKFDTSSNGGTTAFSTSTDTASINVSAVNDAPVLTAAAPVLATLTEDQTANPGQTVASMVAASITDVDAGAIYGIAINGVTSGNGTWEYSTNAGSSWSAVGAVSDSTALLLRATDLVRFVPDGQNATSAALSFRAWDQTSGALGSKVDATSNGGTTAFSTSTDTASISVTAVNDAPVLVPAAPVLLTINEDQTANAGQSVASILAAAVTDSDAGAILGIAVTALNNGNGAWQYSTNSGTSWAAVGVVSDSAALLLRASDLLRLVPNGQNATTADFTFRAWDQTSGAVGSKVDASTNGGTTAFSTATDTASISVSAVNDAPTLGSSASVRLTATDENTPSTPTTVNTLLAASVWADVDSAALKGVAVTGTTGNGSWQYSTDALSWRGFGSVSAGNALLLASTTQVRYVPGSGAANATFAFQAWDQSSGTPATNMVPTYVNPGAGGGSSAFSLAAGSVRIAVAAVPVVVPTVVSPPDPNPVVIPPTPAADPAPLALVPPAQTAPGTPTSGRSSGIIGTPGSAIADSAAALEQAITAAILKDNSLSFAPSSVRLVAASVVAITHPLDADAQDLNEWDFSTIDFKLNALLRVPAAESSNWSPPGAVLSLDSGAGANDDETSANSRPLLSFENGVKFSGALATAGFVAWALRSAGIMTTLLVSMPAWRHLDPIPVLSPDEAKPDWEREAGDNEQNKQDHDAASEAAVAELLRRESA